MVACDFSGGLGAQQGGTLPAGGRDQELRATRVLVVDDHVDTAEVIQTVLDISGYEARTAHTGAQALEIASQFTPDLAIVDIRLPDMNGYDLAERLREAAASDGRGLRLIALSGVLVPTYELATRFDQIVRKPVGGAELRRLLRHFEPR